MGQVMSRIKDCRSGFRERRNGGIGAFTPDNVPVFDWVAPNVYMIADSNHGFKMTGVGKLVARLLMGDRVPELEPFALGGTPRGGPSAHRTATPPGCSLLRVGRPARARHGEPDPPRDGGAAGPIRRGRPRRHGRRQLVAGPVVGLGDRAGRCRRPDRAGR